METINTDKEQPRYDNDNVTLSPLVLYWTEGYVIVSTEIPLPSDGFLFDLLEPWDVISALHKENSGFAAPTLGRHISTFHGYQILFSIRNPYINLFTNHFSIHS